MNRRRILWLVAVGSLLLAGIASNELAPPAVAKEKAASGKALYKQYCKACHAPGSEFGEYSPLTLIQDQWDRFFDKKLVSTHGELEAPDGSGKKLLEAIDEEMLKKIRSFAFDHAADSESPMTCG